jgi:hypothetical protein
VWFSDEVDAAEFANFLNQELNSDEEIRALDIEKERDWYKKFRDKQE